MVALPYPITIEPGSLDQLNDVVSTVSGTNRVAVITDSNVARSYGARVARVLGIPRSSLITIPAGERHKTRGTWQRLTDTLIATRHGRDTTIVALGGGVVGDVAGFVAATYMRGVPYVQVPTSLIAMVDASIGGKTGVDTVAGKNLVGAFHNPAAVVIDPMVLKTLPEKHQRAGFAEIIKHGVVADAPYFEHVTAFLVRGMKRQSKIASDLGEIIRRSVEIKASVVTADEREAGRRKVLNFGHTIGHAIEAASLYKRLHGECVAIGMVVEARLAEHVGVATKGTARAVEETCRSAGLPISLPKVTAKRLVALTKIDKKARGGRVEYALPERIGRMAGANRGWAIPLEDTVVLEALAR